MVKVYYWRHMAPYVQAFDTLEAAMLTAEGWEDDGYCSVKFVVDADGREYDGEAITHWYKEYLVTHLLVAIPMSEIKQTEYETFHDEQWEVV